ncbi:SPOPL [Cordylochernes scorpioides]|uniref:SPOPL n=1 Tax=Cordylochernes scorpioides TaxID=51811 RepID=A0ABY6KMZ2_9ARAC|nr:SPOPL [Cordylochernes scorpioides]
MTTTVLQLDSHSKVEIYSILWAIDNLSHYQKDVGQDLKSSIFSSSDNSRFKWYLSLYPNGKDEKSEGCLSLFLNLDSFKSRGNINVAYAFSIVNSAGEKSNIFQGYNRFYLENEWGWDDFVKKEHLFDERNGLLLGDQLVIYCEITIKNDPVDITTPSFYSPFKVPECKIIENMKFLLESKKLSDISLIVSGHTVHAHKNILAARSPVFAAMFEHEMKENKENLVEIEHMEPEVLEEMVRFIYTGQSPKLDSMADRLLPAADKYGLERLKVMCEVSLASNLTVENSIDVLLLADTYSALQLKKFCLDIINKFSNLIIKTEGWRSNLKFQHHLVAELCTVQSSKEFPFFLPVISPECTKDKVSKFWCHTKDSVTKFSFTWTIHNYSTSKIGIGKYIQSSAFFTQYDSFSYKWCMDAYPDGIDVEQSGFLSLYIKLLSNKKTEIHAKFRFYLLNLQGEKINLKISTFRKFVRGATFGFSKYIKTDILFDKEKGLLPGDKLTIICEIAIIEDTQVTSGKIEDVQFQVPICRLSADLTSLLERQKFSDVVLMASHHRILAHKNILAVRCPQFDLLFEQQMEKKQNIISIDGLTPEVLEEILRFIYAGESPNLDNMADRLLPAADKYGLERLKVMCEVHLASNLTLEKAADVLILADKHNADQLKTETINFIVKHSKNVLEIEEWLTKLHQRPHLFSKLFNAQARCQDSFKPITVINLNKLLKNGQFCK